METDSVPTLRALEVDQYLDGETRPEVSSDPPTSSSPSGQLPNEELVKQASNVAAARLSSTRSGMLAWGGALVAALLVVGFALSQSRDQSPRPLAMGLAEPLAALELPAERQASTAPLAAAQKRPGEPSVEPVNTPASELPAYSEFELRRMEFIVGGTRRRAERCHWQGRAVGTVRLSITFDPDGSVSDFVLKGEPVASAPVAVCIESLYRGMVIPAFAGEPFTMTEDLTLR